MKRMLGLVLALTVMTGMSVPTFAQDKAKAEAKKGTPADTKNAGKTGDAKKAKKATDKAGKTETKAAAKKGATDKDAKKEATKK